MISYLLAGPAEEPVPLAETKAFLRLDADNEDALVTSLVAAARLHVEAVAGIALCEQSWRLVLDGWPDEIALPVTPLLGLSEARLFDETDDEHALSLDAFSPVPGTGLVRVTIPDDVPAMRARLGLELDYRAGFAVVPADLKQAVLRLVGYWFENRDAVTAALVPAGFDRLLLPYRQVRL